MSYDRALVAKAYANIDNAGKTACQTGTLGIFQGFGNELTQTFIAAALPPAEPALIDFILDIGAAASGKGLGLISAGANYPFHLTLAQGRGGLLPNPAGVARFVDGMRETFSSLFLHHLHGVCIAFDTLAMDAKGGIILGVGNIPDAIFEMRAHIARLLNEHTINPIVPENMLHATIARVTSVPEQDSMKRLQEFRLLFEEAQGYLRGDPIVVRIGDFYLGSTFHLLTTQP